MPAKEAPFIDFLLIGGGLASVTAAESLRVAGAAGSIAILSAENTLPYYRPPLSKEFLVTGPDQTQILIHDHSFYRERDIDIHLGSHVREVHVESRTIETDGGDLFRFGNPPGANFAVWTDNGKSRMNIGYGLRQVGTQAILSAFECFLRE